MGEEGGLTMEANSRLFKAVDSQMGIEDLDELSDEVSEVESEFRDMVSSSSLSSGLDGSDS